MKKIKVNSPEDLKGKSTEQLNQIALELREFLIQEVSKTGGHLASNLGIVELTMALHINFNSPIDKLIFDVGHQGYVHKIITGRRDEFSSLRQHNGLSGFLKTKESIHDVWEAGHSSTSISAATGFAYARDLNQETSHVVAIIGDGSLTNGMSLEAMNHIASLNQRVIIILNDNERSICKNVGFIDDILKNLQYSTEYETTKIKVKKTLRYIPLGDSLAKVISKSKAKVKQRINTSENFFNLMGFKYFGTVDGHSFEALNKALIHAKSFDGPTLIHVKTQKGRGYNPAIVGNWHGIAPFDIKTGDVVNKKPGISYSKVVANRLSKLMKVNQDIVVITPAMGAGSELIEIEKNFPNRYTDVGIAEEHALTFAAALALSGKRPFVSIYSTFLQRAYDQVFHDLSRQNANVVIGIDRAGIVGEDGETHQGIYDISFLSHMDNMTIAMGKNDYETEQLLELAFKTTGVFALRYPRGGDFKNNNTYLESINYGTWEMLKTAPKNYIITYGPNVERLIKIFKKDDNIGIINARFIKPLDAKMLLKLKTKNLFIIEEHIRIGGLNNLILDFYNQNNIKKTIGTLAFNDTFILQGKTDTVLKEQNMSNIRIKKIINGYFYE